MKSIIAFICIVGSQLLHAQDGSTMKFGKVTSADFSTPHLADTSVGAVVLSDIGSTQIIGNRKGSLSLEFKRFRRIHILNKTGYEHASKTILLYSYNQDRERLTDLRAATYNLDNGQVQTTRFEQSDGLFSDQVNKNWVAQKFSLPQVREGSIIEYEYKIQSDFPFNLQPWTFQDNIPTLWSEYKVGIPQFLNYVLIGQGTQDFFLREQKDKTGTYSLEVPKQSTAYGGDGVEGEMVNVTCGLTEFRWVMKDVPALRTEAFTTTTNNYVSKLDFQLAGYREPFIEKNIMTTWPEFAQDLLKDENFGSELTKAMQWLQAEVPVIVKNAVTDISKAQHIYHHIRDKFTCTDYDQVFTTTSLKTIFERKSGGVAELNLLLVAMLRTSGLKAHAVLLSTKSNGTIYQKYPILDRFNYVICKTTIDGKEIFLDASHSYMGFGRLDPECYNGLAKTVDEMATDIVLKADDLRESETTNVTLTANEKGEFTGKVNKLYPYYRSVLARKKIAAEGMAAFQKQLLSNLDGELTISELQIDSLEKDDQPMRLKYDIRLTTDGAEILYINSLLGERYKSNPFRSPQRLYPVEWPYKHTAHYSLYMTLPPGYKVEEMPKSVVIKLPGDMAVFEYKLTQTGNAVRLVTRLDISNTKFLSSEYLDLREFFNQVVAKQSEQLVLKKIK